MRREENVTLMLLDRKFSTLSSNWLSSLIQISFLIKQAQLEFPRITFLSELESSYRVLFFNLSLHPRKAHAILLHKSDKQQKNNSPLFWHFHVARLVHSIFHCYLSQLRNFTLFLFVSMGLLKTRFSILNQNFYYIRNCEKLALNLTDFFHHHWLVIKTYSFCFLEH